MMGQRGKKHQSFTLVEVLISVAILSILSAAVASIVFLVLRSTSKTNLAKEVKQNGEGAVAVIQEFIRSAESVVGGTTFCDGENETYVSVVAVDGETTRFDCREDKIASTSGTTSLWLTNELVVCSNFIVSCQQSSNGNPLVSFSFSLTPITDYPQGGGAGFTGKVLLISQ